MQVICLKLQVFFFQEQQLAHHLRFTWAIIFFEHEACQSSGIRNL